MNDLSDPEYRAFIRAILDNPDDDNVRLMFADWLDENHLAKRAEFIRCSVSGEKSGPVAVRRRELFASQPKLIGWHSWDGWAPDDATTPYAIFRRGFVEEIRLSLAQFAGGACGRCDNTERDYPPELHAAIFSGCPDCQGTGHTPGIAGELFREHPITKVVLTDEELVESLGGVHISGRHFTFLRPETLMLAGIGLGLNEFPTREAALEALSAACIAYGKSRAFPVEQREAVPA